MFESAIVRIDIPYALTLPANPLFNEDGTPGTPNPLFPLVAFLNDQVPNYIQGLNQRTYRGTWDLQKYTYLAEISLDMMNVQTVALFLSLGGEISFLPMWGKVDPSATVPNREETWQEFIDSTPNFDFMEIGEDRYVTTAVFGNGNYMKASEAVAVFGLENLRTMPQIKALKASAEAVGQQEPE
jgi:hypothetical protein